MCANIQNNAGFRPKHSAALGCGHILELCRQSHSPIHLDDYEEKSVLPKSPRNRDTAPLKRGCAGNNHQKAVCRKEERPKRTYCLLRTRINGAIQIQSRGHFQWRQTGLAPKLLQGMVPVYGGEEGASYHV